MNSLQKRSAFSADLSYRLAEKQRIKLFALPLLLSRSLLLEWDLSATSLNAGGMAERMGNTSSWNAEDLRTPSEYASVKLEKLSVVVEHAWSGFCSLTKSEPCVFVLGHFTVPGRDIYLTLRPAIEHVEDKLHPTGDP